MLKSHLVRAGLIMTLIGFGPLILVILFAPPDSNPVGFGILSVFVGWPGVLITVLGILKIILQRVVGFIRRD